VSERQGLTAPEASVRLVRAITAQNVKGMQRPSLSYMDRSSVASKGIGPMSDVNKHDLLYFENFSIHGRCMIGM
jgi:hypothetical protein